MKVELAKVNVGEATVKDGKINPSRHNSYVEMYNEVKDIKE